MAPDLPASLLHVGRCSLALSAKYIMLNQPFAKNNAALAFCFVFRLTKALFLICGARAFRRNDSGAYLDKRTIFFSARGKPSTLRRQSGVHVPLVLTMAGFSVTVWYVFYSSVGKTLMKTATLLSVLSVFLVTLQANAQNKVADLNLDDWPKDHRKAVEEMMEKYGQPDEATASMVIWNNNGPWEKTIIYKEEWQHDFPKGHKDYVEQFINYEPVEDKFDEIAQYDGSVILERTAGLMSARCDKERMNFLAINLAHEIMTGKRNVKDAREFYAKTAVETMMGGSSVYTEKFLFNLPEGDTGDPDEGMVMKGVTEAAEDVFTGDKNKDKKDN